GFQPQIKMYGGWKPPLQKKTTSERDGYFGLRRSPRWSLRQSRVFMVRYRVRRARLNRRR
ncbi:MAG: hypothetical protein WCH39_20590, partial [Schlesneria sp.]